jgi:hypothetical protein
MNTPAYMRSSDFNENLDTLQVHPDGSISTARLGGLSQSWLQEYEQLKQIYPGFVGFRVLSASVTGQVRMACVPFLEYKQDVEQYVLAGQYMIEDVWRDPYASEFDQDTVALGVASAVNKRGFSAKNNLLRSGIPRHYAAKLKGLK